MSRGSGGGGVCVALHTFKYIDIAHVYSILGLKDNIPEYLVDVLSWFTSYAYFRMN